MNSDGLKPTDPLIDVECPYCHVNMKVHCEDLTLTCSACWLSFNVVANGKEMSAMDICADGLTVAGLIPDVETGLDPAFSLANVIDKLTHEATLIAANTPGKIALKNNLLGCIDELEQVKSILKQRGA